MLVAFVVLLFLQNWRSAIIPLIAVPVAILGTFAVMLAMGFTLNNLTLFGLVLAIGIVVDDAIVVVEAVEHHIEHGMSPRDATIQAMSQVSGPVIAVGLVLSAVFVPCAFISGVTGQFFRQFALTIAASTIISAFNSLTLSPALAAMFLRRATRRRTNRCRGSLSVLWRGWLAYALARAVARAAGSMRAGRPHSPCRVRRRLARCAVDLRVAGSRCGWLIGKPLQSPSSRWLFRLLQSRLQCGHRLLHPRASACCSASARSCSWFTAVCSWRPGGAS